MKEKEKDQLRQREIMSELKPDKRTLTNGYGLRNANRTGEEDPKVGSCWKEYWQIFTQEDFPSTCPFCGLHMNEDEIDGCHIKIAGVLQGSWSDKKYIIPGHHDCNLKYNAEFESKIEVTAVEAIKK